MLAREIVMRSMLLVWDELEDSAEHDDPSGRAACATSSHLTKRELVLNS
jgi:hypothetical protein